MYASLRLPPTIGHHRKDAACLFHGEVVLLLLPLVLQQQRLVFLVLVRNRSQEVGLSFGEPESPLAREPDDVFALSSIVIRGALAPAEDHAEGQRADWAGPGGHVGYGNAVANERVERGALRTSDDATCIICVL